MKFTRFILLAAFFAPVFASAQATYTLPIGNNFGIDTKIPVTFDQQEFNKKFAKQMSSVRAFAAWQASSDNTPLPTNAKEEEQPAANEENYTQCIVCHEKILKSDGYQITPKRDWYVKKHSPCACQFYKGWQSTADTSFRQTAAKRNECELSMDSKYATHTCAICGKPINVACGSVSTWEDSKGKHYAHSDCFAWQRYNAEKDALLRHLDITETDCERYDRQAQEQKAAQQKLIEEMQESSEQIRQQVQKETEPVVTFTPGTRSFKKVSRDLNRFNTLHGSALHKAIKDQQDGKELTKKQKKLIKRFTDLREEYQRASAAESK